MKKRRTGARDLSVLERSFKPRREQTTPTAVRAGCWILANKKHRDGRLFGSCKVAWLYGVNPSSIKQWGGQKRVRDYIKNHLNHE